MRTQSSFFVKLLLVALVAVVILPARRFTRRMGLGKAIPLTYTLRLSARLRFIEAPLIVIAGYPVAPAGAFEPRS